MKRYCFGYLFISLFMFTSVVFAQKFESGVNFIYANANQEIMGGMGGEVFVNILTPGIVLFKTSVSYYGAENKIRTLSEGNYNLLSLEETMIIRAKTETIRPFFGGGIGYYSISHDLSQRLKNTLLLFGLRLEEDIKDKMGFHLTGGFEIEASPNISINAGIKYLFLKPTVDITVTDLFTFYSIALTENIDLSTIFLLLGINIRI